MFLRMIQHLLPNAAAWTLTVDSKLRQFFTGLTGLGADAKEFYDLIWNDLDPQNTRELQKWETQFGLPDTLTNEQDRRDRLDATWKALGGQSPRYIQDTLQAAGFDVYVHEWWTPGTEPAVGVKACATPRDPFLYLNDGLTPLRYVSNDGGVEMQDGNMGTVPFSQMNLESDLSFQQGTSPATFTRAAPDASYIDAADGLLKFQTTDIPRFEADGFLVEESEKNHALWNRDLTNAAWVKTSCTAAKDAIGLDGVANSASTLTATGANATCLQTVTKVSADNTYSVDIKRKTGVGAVEITLDNGVTWLDITSSLSSLAYFRETVTQTLANPIFGLRLVASGDEVEVDFNQCEEDLIATSRIPTTTVAVTRAADVCSILNANIPTLSSGCTITCEAAIPIGSPPTGAVFWIGTPGITRIRKLSTGLIAARIGDVSIPTVYAPDELNHQYAIRTDGTTHELLVDGVVWGTATGALVQPTNDLFIGSSTVGAQQPNGHIKHLNIYDRYVSDGELKWGTAIDGATLQPSGYPLVNKILTPSTEPIGDGSALMMDGGLIAMDGGLITSYALKLYQIPAVVAEHSYFLYIGGQTFPDHAIVAQSRKNEFETLCLKICPAQQWLGILVNYS